MMFTTHAFDCSHHLTKELLKQFPKVDEIKQVYGRAFAHPSMAIPKMKMLPGTLNPSNQPPVEEVENISSQNLLSRDELIKNNLLENSNIPEEKVIQLDVQNVQESYNVPHQSKENVMNVIEENKEKLIGRDNKDEKGKEQTKNKVALLMKSIKRPDSQEQSRVSKINNFIINQSEKLSERDNQKLIIKNQKESDS